MNIQELMGEVNNLIDDQLPNEMIMPWINDAIAMINSRTPANFPFYTQFDLYEEPPIPETYQRTLIIVYAAARAKEQDSSQFEYQDLYDQFFDNLNEFINRYEVPEEYKSDARNSFESDIMTTPPYNYGGW